MQEIEKEELFVNKYNGRFIHELPLCMQQRLIKAIKKNDGIVEVKKRNSYAKGRVIMTIGISSFNIQIKENPSNSIHNEFESSFFGLLSQLKTPIDIKMIIKMHLLFKKQNYEFEIFKREYKNQINKANEFFNKYQKLFLYRFLFQGKKESNPMTDFIYLEDGEEYFISKEEIQHHILYDNKINYEEVRLSPFTFNRIEKEDKIKFYLPELKTIVKKISYENNQWPVEPTPPFLSSFEQSSSVTKYFVNMPWAILSPLSIVTS